jgi:hypothetical protein
LFEVAGEQLVVLGDIRLLPPSLFERPAAELSVDDSA